jgi:hypothetical protein
MVDMDIFMADFRGLVGDFPWSTMGCASPWPRPWGVSITSAKELVTMRLGRVMWGPRGGFYKGEVAEAHWNSNMQKL